jgi:hypothetical protein
VAGGRALELEVARLDDQIEKARAKGVRPRPMKGRP